MFLSGCQHDASEVVMKETLSSVGLTHQSVFLFNNVHQITSTCFSRNDGSYKLSHAVTRVQSILVMFVSLLTTVIQQADRSNI